MADERGKIEAIPETYWSQLPATLETHIQQWSDLCDYVQELHRGEDLRDMGDMGRMLDSLIALRPFVGELMSQTDVKWLVPFQTHAGIDFITELGRHSRVLWCMPDRSGNMLVDRLRPKAQPSEPWEMDYEPIFAGPPIEAARFLNAFARELRREVTDSEELVLG